MAKSKKILITGASSGIGRATAKLLASQGHELLLVARRLDRLHELQAELQSTNSGAKGQAKNNAKSDAKSGNVRVAELDITDAAAVEKFVVEQKAWLKEIDVLINNAGLALGREAFQNSNFSDVESMIHTNILALLRLTRKILPFMIERKTGHLINLGSVAGKTAYPAGTVYCATKSAVHMITDALRIDLGGTGIRVSTVAPGRVAETEFSVVRYKGDIEKAKQVYEGYRPLTSAEVAENIAWILNQPTHINIQELVIMPTDQPSATMLAPLDKN